MLENKKQFSIVKKLKNIKDKLILTNININIQTIVSLNVLLDNPISIIKSLKL